MTTSERTTIFSARNLVVLTLCLIVLVAMRLHAWSLPLETDEANYAYIGSRLMAGDRLYVDVWDHQPPGAFALFGLVGAVFGNTDTTYRVLATIASATTCILIFLTLLNACSFQSAMVGAGLFALTSADPGTAGDGCNREIFMNMLCMGAFTLLFWHEKLRTMQILLAGLLLGIASTLKTVIAAPWLLLTLWTCWQSWKIDHSWRQWVKTAVLMSIGPTLVWMTIFGYFALTDRWTQFVDAVFLFNLGYADVDTSFLQRFSEFFTNNRFAGVIRSGLSIWTAGAVGFLVLILRWSSNGHSIDRAAIVFLIGSFIAVCLPAQFWSHYYRLLWPALILTIAISISRLPKLYHRNTTAIIVIATLLLQGWYYLFVPSHEIGEPTFAYRRAWAKAIGEKVATVTEPDDSIFVWGNDAGIYHYANRGSASRYTMITGLLDNAMGHEKGREQLLMELHDDPPRVVIIAEPEFDALKTFLQSRYIVAGLDHDDRQPNMTIMVALTLATNPVTTIDWDWYAPWLDGTNK